MREWLLTVIVLGHVFLAGSVGVYFVMIRPAVAIAQIQIVSPNPAGHADLVANQTILIGSHFIAQRTAESKPMQQRLEGSEFRSFPDTRTPEDLRAKIMNGLTITRDLKNPNPSTLLTVTFRAKDAEEAQFILGVLIDTYQSYVDDVFFEPQRTYVNKLELSRKELGETIKANEHDPAQVDKLHLAKATLDDVTERLDQQYLQQRHNFQIKLIKPPQVRR